MPPPSKCSTAHPTNFCIHFSSPIHPTCPNNLILLDLITEIKNVRSTDQEAVLCTVYSTITLLSPAYTEIYSSEPYLQALSANVPLTLRNTKFHTHTKQKTKFHYLHFNLYILRTEASSCLVSTYTFIGTKS
jgi:hypothetical protein